MKLIDPNFRNDPVRYILQCILATMTILVVLVILDSILSTTIVATLGASTFIAFTMPHKSNSRPRNLVGGYLMGTLAGIFCNFLARLPIWTQISIIQLNAEIVLGAVAVGLAIFLMVVTDTEHPPAAGLALGYMLNEYTFCTVLVVFIGILSLVGIKSLLKSQLIDL